MPDLNYVLGVDVSKWQGMMNWDKAAAAGAKYAVARAGSIDQSTGVLYIDDQFERNSIEAPKRMPTGFYWYFRPQYDAIKQADYFSNLIKDKDNKLRPVIDVETEGGQTPQVIATRVLQFLDHVEKLVKIKPKIYTRMSFWNPYVARHPRWKEHDLWVARYNGNLTSPWSDGYYKPLDWPLDGWGFWQASADGNMRGPEFGAQSASIDLNYFNGDWDKFQAYLGVVNPPPPPPPTEVTMIVSDLKSITGTKGTNTIEFVVPPGEEWFIQAAHAFMNLPCVWARIGIKDVNSKSVFLSSMSASEWRSYLAWTGVVTLVAGEKLSATFEGVAAGTILALGFRGEKTLA